MEGALKKVVLDYVSKIDIENIMKARISRTEMKPGHHYMMIQGKTINYAGKFVSCYRMGSGDGMTVHFIFDLNNTQYILDDQMWGSISGEELMYFTENTDL
jgi:hypothetical protein